MEIEFQLLTSEHMSTILHIQEEALRVVEREGQLQPLSEAEYRFILDEGRGMMLGAFLRSELIAFRALLHPFVDEAHLGQYVRLPKEVWPHMYYSEITIVHPDARGKSLQKRLGERLMSLCEAEHIAATVAPDNIPSILDKFHLGFQLYALEQVYGDHWRYVFRRDRQSPVFSEKCTIAKEEEEKQRQRFADGWIGTSYNRLTNELCLER